MAVSKGKRLLLLGILLVVIDQVIKVLVKTNMSVGEHFSVLGDWFQILFIENEGMAFGMKFGGAAGKLALSLFRIGLCAALCWWITRLVRKGTSVYAPAVGPVADGRPRVPAGVLIGLTLITAGAFGNIIDCLFYGMCFSASEPGVVASFGGSYAPFLFGRVVDMFYFPLWRWPDWMPLVGGDIFFEPVFNFADSCVSVGAVYLILFQYKFFSAEDKAEEKAEAAGRKK